MRQQSDWTPPLRFSTEDLPEKDRLAIWTEEFGRTIFKVEWKPLPGRPFFMTATLQRLLGLGISITESNGLQAARTRQLVAEGGDSFRFKIFRDGISHHSQLGREVTIGAGEGMLTSCEDGGSALYPGAYPAVALSIPRQALSDRLPDPEAALMRLIPGSNEALRLLAEYLSALDGTGLQMTPDTGSLAAVFASHALDLCALALIPSREVLHRAGAGLRAARLQAIKSDLLVHLGDSRLSLAAVAQRHGVTPRYVQRLFEPEGITFSEFLLSARLERARRMLADPGAGEHTIASIAYQAGFSDPFYFSRAFRKRYGMTPTDVRTAARQEKDGK